MQTQISRLHSLPHLSGDFFPGAQDKSLGILLKSILSPHSTHQQILSFPTTSTSVILEYATIVSPKNITHCLLAFIMLPSSQKDLVGQIRSPFCSELSCGFPAWSGFFSYALASLPQLSLAIPRPADRPAWPQNTSGTLCFCYSCLECSAPRKPLKLLAFSLFNHITKAFLENSCPFCTLLFVLHTCSPESGNMLVSN